MIFLNKIFNFLKTKTNINIDNLLKKQLHKQEKVILVITYILNIKKIRVNNIKINLIKKRT